MWPLKQLLLLFQTLKTCPYPVSLSPTPYPYISLCLTSLVLFSISIPFFPSALPWFLLLPFSWSALPPASLSVLLGNNKPVWGTFEVCLQSVTHHCLCTTNRQQLIVVLASCAGGQTVRVCIKWVPPSCHHLCADICDIILKEDIHPAWSRSFKSWLHSAMTNYRLDAKGFSWGVRTHLSKLDAPNWPADS